MKKTEKNTETLLLPKVICILDTHHVVIALSEYLPLKQGYEITYAHQSRIVHNDTITAAEKLSKIYDMVALGFKKLSDDVKIKPETVHIFLGDTLSTTVYRKHTMHRKTAFVVSDKLLNDMKDRDYARIQKNIQDIYKTPHTITHTAISGRMVNGYPFTDSQNTLPEKVFSLEHVLTHTLVPTYLCDKISDIIRDVYHADIPVVLRNLSSLIMDFLTTRISGSWLYVHVGESLTTLGYVQDGNMTSVTTLPMGTASVTERVMSEMNMGLADTVRLLKLAHDGRINDGALVSVRNTIDIFWDNWRSDVSKQLQKLVTTGAVIPKVIYSYDTEYLPIDQYVFPGDPHELWYGVRNVVHVPCESILDETDNTVSRAYLRSLLRHIQKTIIE
jgi:hypothetical protein